jgi:hypothetical protein
MRVTICLAFALLVTPALGAPKAGQGKKYLDAAIKLYGAFEFERALAQLEKARKLSEGPEMDVTIALYMGIVQLELGHDDQAESELRTALSLDGNAVLPTRVSPKVQQLFDGLKAQMNKPPEKVEPPPPTPAPAPAPEPVAPPRPAVRQTSGSAPSLWWAPGAAGVLLAAAGVVLLFEAKGMNDALLGHGATEPDPMTALQYRTQGPTFQALGFAGIAVGAACVAVSAVLLFLGPKLFAALTPSTRSTAWAEVW